MNHKGNWYIKLRTTKRCDMIKKKARRSPPLSNCIRTALGLEIQKMMNREYNRHEIKGLKFEEISEN